MEIPKFDSEKYSIIIVQSKTGKVLNKDRTFYESVGENYYQTFESLKEAEIFVEDEIKKGDVDISIFDKDGNFLKVYRPSLPN